MTAWLVGSPLIAGAVVLARLVTRRGGAGLGVLAGTGAVLMVGAVGLPWSRSPPAGRRQRTAAAAGVGRQRRAGNGAALLGAAIAVAGSSIGAASRSPTPAPRRWPR